MKIYLSHHPDSIPILDFLHHKVLTKVQPEHKHTGLLAFLLQVIIKCLESLIVNIVDLLQPFSQFLFLEVRHFQIIIQVQDALCHDLFSVVVGPHLLEKVLVFNQDLVL